MYGHKTMQELVIKPKLNDIRQPNGLNYIDGTNYHLAIGMGIDIK
jgi:hypothetical protein